MFLVSGMNWSLVSVLKANLGLSALSKASRLLVNNPRRYLNYYSKSVSDIKLCIVKIWGGLSSVYDTIVINTRWLQRQQSSYKMGWVWIYWVILNNSDMSFSFVFLLFLWNFKITAHSKWWKWFRPQGWIGRLYLLKANLDLFASSKASRLLVKNPRSYLNY